MADSYLYAITAVLLACASQIILKKKASKAPKSFIRKFLNAPVIFSYLLLFASLALNSLALRKMEMSVLPCITATSFLWITLLSAVFLGEKPTKRRLAGIAMIMIGVVVSHL